VEELLVLYLDSAQRGMVYGYPVSNTREERLQATWDVVVGTGPVADRGQA
jgi:hypothetical protein